VSEKCSSKFGQGTKFKRIVLKQALLCSSFKLIQTKCMEVGIFGNSTKYVTALEI
jgi:hypothetical protein